MAYQFKNASVLVVDDMQPMLSLVTSLLKIFGFTNIIQAFDAEEGLVQYRHHNPDLVLTDWLMEPYDGIELTRRIRSEDKSPNRFVPIVMMTGYSHRMRVEEARDAGVTEFLVKPFRAKDLYSRVEQLIEKPRRFVDAGEFFGPDRRRRKVGEFQGPFRRDVDSSGAKPADNSAEADELLRNLRKQATEAARNKKT